MHVILMCQNVTLLFEIKLYMDQLLNPDPWSFSWFIFSQCLEIKVNVFVLLCCSFGWKSGHTWDFASKRKSSDSFQNVRKDSEIREQDRFCIVFIICLMVSKLWRKESILYFPFFWWVGWVGLVGKGLYYIILPIWN